MEQEKINQAIGELLIKDKYKFIPTGLVGEIIRDFLEEVKMIVRCECGESYNLDDLNEYSVCTNCNKKLLKK